MNQAETQFRKELLQAMDTYMSEYQPYEEAYAMWISDGMPDEADESDFDFVAGDDKIFADVCEAFARIVRWVEQEKKGE